MGISPETRYIQKIHRQVKKFPIYHHKMNMMPMSANGIPDMYYEGPKGILWVEYKQVADWTKKRTIPWSKISPQQHLWLERAINNNVQCAVIIGDDNGKGIVIKNQEILLKPELKNYEFLSPQDVTKFIRVKTCE